MVAGWKYRGLRVKQDREDVSQIARLRLLTSPPEPQSVGAYVKFVQQAVDWSARNFLERNVRRHEHEQLPEDDDGWTER